ncbi:MAG TPA: hypothetical protein PLX89_07220 [Verrucomicrobiota bacterium]|nr:hypothetical protein [Verrucomicrobiales bacterium]HRI12781.1 hypothetical protein [Verrucomicrobiota bacterium]
MNQETRTVLSLPTLPARLTVEMTAVLLNFTPEAIYILVSAKKLKPLGRTRPGAQKFFAAEEILRLRADIKWLSDATDAVCDWYAKKNRQSLERRTSNSIEQIPASAAT